MPVKMPHSYVQDPVYGLIPLGQEYYTLINCPWIQRLRRVKQTGVLNLVFPGAEHSRFSHTLGVVHLTRSLYEGLKLGRRGSSFSNEDWLVFLLASILHDSGHMPYSHTIEAVVRAIDKGKLQLYPMDRIKIGNIANEKGADLVKYATLLHGDVELSHEYLAEHVCNAFFRHMDAIRGVKELAKTLGVKCIPDRRTLIERTSKAIREPILGCNLNPLKATIDVDRLDYIQRDSLASGVHYGKIAVDHLLRHMRVARINLSPSKEEKKLQQDGWSSRKRGLAFLDSRQYTVEHLILSRYALYSNVIAHESNIGWSLLLQAAMIGLLSRDDLTREHYCNISCTLQDPARLKYLTDGFIDYRLASQYSLEHGDTLGELSRVWVKRRSPICILTIRRLIRQYQKSLVGVIIETHQKLDEIITRKSLRKYVYPSLYTLPVLPREKGGQESEGSDITAYILKGNGASSGRVARSIQACDDSLLKEIYDHQLVFYRIHIWGELSPQDESYLRKEIRMNQRVFNSILTRHLRSIARGANKRN